MNKAIAAARSLTRKVPLWPRLVVGVSLCFLTLLVIIGVLTLRAGNQSRDRIFQDRLVIAEMAASQVDGIFAQSFIELQRASDASALSTQGTDPQQLSNGLQQALQNVNDDMMWQRLYLLDSSGKVIASSPTSQNPSSEAIPAAAGFVLSATESNQVSAPYVDELTGKPAVLLVVSRPGSKGESKMFLGGVIDLSRPEFLSPLRDATRLGNTAHAELFDNRGLVIASTEPSAFLGLSEHLHSYLPVLKGKAAVVKTMPLEPRNQAEAMESDQTHVMAVVPLASMPWGVSVGGSEAETLAPVIHLRNEMLLVGGVSLAIMWVLSLVGARLLVHPVRALTTAADRMTAGDLETLIHVREGGEIGQLGQSLNDMRLRLKSSLQEIEQRDRDLERRVAERTLEVQTLYEELQRKEELRGRLLEKVISAQEDERKRIARELHDETGQALTGIIMSLEVAEEALTREPLAASQRLETAKTLASQSIAAIRRLVVDLRPAALDDLGLVPAIRAFAGARLEERGIQLDMHVAGLSSRLDPSVETCLFRVAQEAVTNVVRHSGANLARIELRRSDGFVSLLVRDDGQGFNVGETLNSDDPAGALGLAGMEERVALLGGQLTVESRPGQGTVVRAKVPVREPSP